MTKEIREIVKAYKKASREGRRTALATVVHVEGSSYRMPGARMLVEDNGQITGAISGGCLEGDAMRKALQAITQNQNRLVTYNTLDEDDIEFGVQLGCNGIVHILFEPLDAGDHFNALAVLEKYCEARTPAVLVTLFSLSDPFGAHPGTSFVMNDAGADSRVGDTEFGAQVYGDARKVLCAETSILKHYDTYGMSAFFELLLPPVSLVVIGAGNDATPLVSLAGIMGWEVTIADGRKTHANAGRFSTAHKIIVAKSHEVADQLVLDERTAIVLMTHNYNYDLEVMKSLLQVDCGYLGVLGPCRRLERIFNDLDAMGVAVSDRQRKRVHGPVGLDIGAETPEEIALSIISEIKAVFANRAGGYLRNREGAIHSRPAQATVNAAAALRKVG